LFVWGSLSIKAIVESVTQKFTLFNPTGLPLRATLSVTFREYKTLQDQLAELNLQSPDHTKRRVVRQYDTLNRIATEEYKDPHQWRLIALNNAQVLSSFRRLVPGTVLIIPPIELPGKSPRTS
jgi:nucleoid-associated protein YgaU